MNQFQSLFENVCRCFGHTPTGRHAGGGLAGDPFENSGSPRGDNDASEHHRQSITTVNSEASSVSGKRRTNQLKLNDKQYDELFDKVKRGSSKTPKHMKNANRSSNGQPPRPGGQKDMNGSVSGMTSISDHDTARALAQAKLAANPPRYRSKRKRPAQTREEIFRNKNGTARSSSSANCVGGKPAASASRNATSTPKTDFARLLNPSLALCFATPIRGTEEEQEELDQKSVDHSCSDTATLNTNGDDTITSTLYFDSKYAHIQESTPPMPLFSDFKIGHANDEIRTIMATDSHSSVRMIKIMEQNKQQEHQHQQQNNHSQQTSRRDQQHNQPHNQFQNRVSATTTIFEEAQGETSMNSETEQLQQKASRSKNHRVPKQSPVASTKGSSRIIKETIKITSDGRDEEMEDAVPDVKPISSSTDSSRTNKHASIQ